MRPKAVRGSGVKMVNMGEIFAHPRLTNVAMERVPLNQSERSRYLLQAGDLLFARQSLVLSGAGKCSIFLRDDEPTTFESHVIRVRLNKVKANPRYYYYYFQSHEGRSAIQSIVEQGAGASGIRATDLAAIDVVWRPIAVQRAIAHILGTLDDKIELNRRMNETLEAMARALFKSWFIDFDPVRAKAALRNHSPLEGESAKAPSGSHSPLEPVESARSKGASTQMSRWGAIKRFYTQQTLQKAQTLRESQTNAEGLLWHYLRDKQLAGYKFRRQQPIGPYIVDFACMPQKLLIELDGGQHAEQHTYDKKRDEFLREKGYKILRFWNNDVFENCFGVLESIRAAVQDPPPQQSAPKGLTTATPPQGGSDWSVERARAYLDRMPQHLADLFPDCLVDSELGPIPEGWEVKALSSFGKVITGKTPSTRNPQFYENDVPFLKIPDMHGKMYVMGTSTMLSRAGADSQTANGLPPGSISVSCIATPGLVVLNHRETHTNQQINSIIPNDGGTSKYLYWSCRKLASEIMLGGSGGSVFHNMNKSTFSALKILDAGLEVISSFEKLVCPMHEMVLSKEKQNHTLIALRDVLLPKLISGEIRLRHEQIQQSVGRP